MKGCLQTWAGSESWFWTRIPSGFWRKKKKGASGLKRCGEVKSFRRNFRSFWVPQYGRILPNEACVQAVTQGLGLANLK